MTSDWSASPSLKLRPFVVNGVSFPPGIRDDDDVETVLGYVLEQFDKRVERLRNPGCWGFSYRINRNAPGVISNHGRGIAVDANAPAHPNGVPTNRTFSVAQINEVHKILGEVDYVVRWGGDYTGTPDSMHFELNADRAAVARVADRLRGENMPLNPADIELVKTAVREVLNEASIDVGDGKKWSAVTVWRSTLNKVRSLK